MKTAVYLSSRPEWRYIIEEINDGHSSREWGAESEQKERREKRKDRKELRSKNIISKNIIELKEVLTILTCYLLPLD